MKKNLILFALLTLVISFLSCGDDDPNRPQTIVDSKDYSADFMVGANQPTSVLIEMKLSDFSKLKDYLKNVTKGAVDVATILNIEGITEGGYELKNTKFVIEGVDALKSTLVLGTLTADKKTTTLEELKYLQTIVDKMVASGSAKVTFSFDSANKDINRDVKVKTNLNVLFSLR